MPSFGAAGHVASSMARRPVSSGCLPLPGEVAERISAEGVCREIAGRSRARWPSTSTSISLARPLEALIFRAILQRFFCGRSRRLPRCGDPADRRCDHCRALKQHLPAHALCCHCDATLRMCRLCRLELQLRKGLRAPTVRPASESSWEGASQCANCGKIARKLQICSGCMCIRYCSLGCQRLDWKTHKPLCAALNELHPLTFVYPWHMRRARRAAAYDPALLPALAGEI